MKCRLAFTAVDHGVICPRLMEQDETAILAAIKQPRWRLIDPRMPACAWA